jgi:hypothetical protein
MNERIKVKAKVGNPPREGELSMKISAEEISILAYTTVNKNGDSRAGRPTFIKVDMNDLEKGLKQLNIKG